MWLTALDFPQQFNENRHTLVGETHEDRQVIDQVLEPLIQTENYDNLYLEALLRGNYTEEGEKLIPDEKVWNYNPEKYHELVDIAEDHGMEIHGLDNHGDSRKDYEHEISDWANYILETGKQENNLILVGNGHVTQWPEREEPRHLPVYLPNEDEITTVTEPSIPHEQQNGVYTAEKLDENAGDYIYLNEKINTEDQRKAITALNSFTFG